MKKSQKKKLEKKKIEAVLHQHKKVASGYIVTFGFSHPLHLNHKNEDTQKAHDMTIRIDRGEIITRKKKEDIEKVENNE